MTSTATMTIKTHISVAVTDGKRILLVQEEKQENHGKWNLPGGHLEPGELVNEGALREALEETGLRVTLDGLVRIYQNIHTAHSIRFVFRAPFPAGQIPAAGDQILAVQNAEFEQVLNMPDQSLVAPAVLKQIVRDLMNGRGGENEILWFARKRGG